MKKKTIVLIFVHVFLGSAFSQVNREQRLLDSLIGWDPANYFDRNYKPQTSASGKQKEAYTDKFAEWVKKSYLPVSGLGEYQRFVNNLNYQTSFSIWDVDYNHLDPKGRFKPMDETGFPRFQVAANILTGTSLIKFMSRRDVKYLTLQPSGQTDGGHEQEMAERDPRIDPNVYDFVTWQNEYNCAVYLTPDNKLPLVPVNKGEFLQTAMARMDDLQDSLIKADLEKEYRTDEAGKNGIYDRRKKEIGKYRDILHQLLEKYKNELNEPAALTDQQFTYLGIRIGSWDIFKGAPGTKYYPVYKIEDATLQKMKEAKPVWVALLFPYETKNSGNKKYEMYAALTRNLNYRYIYDYFFAPEKVRGVEYKPANEAGLLARHAAYRAKNPNNKRLAAAQRPLPPGVFFQDDFRGETPGSEPGDWFYYRAGGSAHRITTLPGEKGNWLKLGFGRSIKPKFLTAPLPGDFALDYDVVTDGTFTGRTGGAVELVLTTSDLQDNNELAGNRTGDNATVTILAESGNEASYSSNYRGLLQVKIASSPDPNEENHSKGIKAEIPLTQFTDKKTKAHITVQMKNGELTLLVNNKVVIQSADFKMTYGGACKRCAVPPGLRFKNIRFNNLTNEGEAIGVYIGNIQISAG